MKATFTSLVAFLLIAVAAYAQPQVSYIIPDIGAAGMNTYIEIVAPVGATGAFGSNGLYMNDAASAVRVQPSTATDNARIVVGPVVVSWDGRLISTQIFVKPGAANGTVGLTVTTGAGSFTTNEFTIVTPQTLGAGGTLNGGGALGTGGPLGTRSKRGAMIVTNLFLQSGNYTAALIDNDGALGDEGYFPFILISQGPLFMNPGVKIDVNGGTPDGGAGGGGGGGNFCDNIGGNGRDGGKGFTGGGAGGRNAPDDRRSTGVGTGAGGTSRNQVAPGGDGTGCGTHEGAGGGTGHPFGLSGEGFCDGQNYGRQGGGSTGGNQGTPAGGGGGGGYGTDGGNGTGQGTSQNNGKAHGNPQGVPVAGGSGGGSGNPRGFSVCGGSGGGGGGALVLYSMSIFNNSNVEAKGGNGGNGSPNGGAGSGGFVEIGAKVQTSSGGSGDVSGGSSGNGGGGGGAGRARYDGFTSLPPSIAAAASMYVGPTIDTLSYLQTRSFTLRGSFNGDALQIFMRSANSDWTVLGAPSTSGRTWSLPVTVPTSGTYYFCALQRVSGANPGGYSSQPEYVFSQAAANIVTVALIPKIDVDKTTITFPNVICQSSVLDSVKVRNTGDTVLTVSPSIQPAAFSIVSPTGNFTVPANDSVTVVVRFTPTVAGPTPGTLTLTNNDPRPGKNPTVITLQGTKADIQQSLSPTPLDFGNICRDSLAPALSAFFNNGGTIAGSLDSIRRLGTGPQRFTILSPLPGSLPQAVGAGGRIEIRVAFRPDAAGQFADSFRVYVGPCNTAFTVVVRGRGVIDSIEVSPNPLSFGDVRVGTTLAAPVTITNAGTVDGTITGAFITPAGAPFTMPAGLIGTAIAAGASITPNITFAPTTTGQETGTLCIVFGSSCPDTVCIDLRGRGVTSLLMLSRDTVSIEADPCDVSPGTLTDTFMLYNRGLAPVRIDDATATGGIVGITSVPLPRDLAAGDSILFTLTWTPGATGSDRIRIRTQAEDPQQREMFVGVGLRRDSASVELTAADGSALPATIDLGNVFDCADATSLALRLANGGTLPANVTVALVDGSAFGISPASPYTIAAGGTQGITLLFNPTTAGDFDDTLVVREDLCNREIRVPVSGHRYGVSFATTGIGFGNSNVNATRTGSATVLNTSNTPNNVRLNIAGAFIKQTGTAFAIVTPTGLPRSLAPGEAASVDVTFTPTAEIAYSAEICFYTDAPCPDTICQTLSGTGIQSNILVRQTSLNFGTLYICQDSTTLLRVENTGSAPLRILALTIGGTDAAAFEEATGLTLPATVAPGDVVDLKVRFVPSRAASNGLKNGTLTIQTDDAAQPLVVVTLIGERRRQALSTPNRIDFGRVAVGTPVEETLTLENRTDTPMRIESLTIPQPFTIVDPVAPLTVPPFDSIIIRIRFVPTDTSAMAVNMLAVQSTPCADTTQVPVTGQGIIIRTGGATIAISDSLRGAPGDRLAIPILLRSAQLIAESEATTFVATLRFRASMLSPIAVRAKGQAMQKLTAVPSGTIRSSTIDGEDRVVTIEITNDPVPALAPDTLGFLDVLVLLGDSTVTPIRFDTLYWTDGTVQTTTSDGLFTLDGYCVINGERLVERSNSFGIKLAAPNPFNPQTTILFETVEDGATTLAVTDLYGNPVETLIDRRQMKPGAYTQIWNARNFASGVYYVVLTSPTQRSVHQIMLVK